jgi:tetratricopeptide (TPR) repeat protein
VRSAWQVGDQIEGRWEVYKILQGGAGIVYIVYDHAFREPFAAKTFRDEIFSQSPLVAERFVREGLAWIRLDVHPNVTQARMVERIDGKPFLFLEYVSGGDLGSWIGTPRLTKDLPQVLRFAIQFCDGMIHALSKKLRAHRDIKPRNCLITHNGVLKITDFGLAKLFDEDIISQIPTPGNQAQNFNLTATAIGTCTHMAPEQFENAVEVDARADIYAFGVMLYQMVKGELPFVGDTWQDLEHLHKTQPAPYLDTTEKPLANLVQKCLEKDPAQRIGSFKEVRVALESVFKKVVGSAPPEPPQGTALTAVQWSNKGSSLDNLGRRTEALACYDAALKLAPNLAAAWFNKGVALFGSDEPQEALACYEQALRIDPRTAQVWSNKGVVLKSLGKMQEAMACYDRAVQCNPRYPNAWINKGVALRALGKGEEALACYDQALGLNPGDASAWTNRGNILHALGRSEEALASYDRALALNSNLELGWLNKGIALGALGRNDEALQCYGTAIEISPQLQQAWFLRGVTMINAFQQYAEAIPYLEQAERLGVKEAGEVLDLCRKAEALR